MCFYARGSSGKRQDGSQVFGNGPVMVGSLFRMPVNTSLEIIMNINVMWRAGTRMYIYIYTYTLLHAWTFVYTVFRPYTSIYIQSCKCIFFAYTLHPHLLALVTRSLGHGRHEKLPAWGTARHSLSLGDVGPNSLLENFACCFWSPPKIGQLWETSPGGRFWW